MAPAAATLSDLDGNRPLGLNALAVNFPKVARVTGLEPATLGVTGRYSNQLSYTRSPLGEPRIYGRRCGLSTR